MGSDPAARGQIGVLGLGRMGSLIARRLDAAGSRVTVFDHARSRLAAAVDDGLSAAADRFALASTVDVLITVLPGSAETRSALLGPPGVVDVMRAGSCWLDLGCTDPQIAEEIAAAGARRGVASVGAPMMGGPTDAAAGTLGFCIGGSSAALGMVDGVLDELGDPTRRFHVGPDIRVGYVAKLLVNGLWFSQAAAVGEALLLAQAAGIEPELMAAVLRGSPATSDFVERSIPRLLDGDYLANFGVDRVVEELDVLERLATETGTPAEVLATAAQLHRDALAVFGPADGELLAVKLQEQRSARTLRRTATKGQHR